MMALTTDELIRLFTLPEKYPTRLEKAFDKVKTGEVAVMDAINYLMEPLMRDLFPKLPAMDETKEVMMTFMTLVAKMVGKEFFIRMKGLEKPTTLKATIEMYPSLVDFSPVPDEEAEEIPGIEIDVALIPSLIGGKLISDILERRTLDALDVLSGKARYHGLSTIFEWADELDGTLTKSDHVALISLIDKEVLEKVLEQLLPVLDTSLEKFGV